MTGICVPSTPTPRGMLDVGFVVLGALLITTISVRNAKHTLRRVSSHWPATPSTPSPKPKQASSAPTGN
ncbi:hypothetical protein CC2G_011385 [Coprinopsis cinerea AmutBmut pab1-1]|nr:hypothetical protein CC2G_011385 [Coprinopsis cinerea AmutBmut pab1-1]